jgi:hypothetical protein
MNQNISWGKIVVLVVAIIGVGAVAFMWGKKSEVVVAPVTKEVAQLVKKEAAKPIGEMRPAIIIPAMVIPTDWKVWEDKVMGYSFRYPPQAKVVEYNEWFTVYLNPYEDTNALGETRTWGDGVGTFAAWSSIEGLSLQLPMEERTTFYDLMKEPRFQNSVKTKFLGNDAFIVTESSDPLTEIPTESKTLYVSRGSYVYELEYEPYKQNGKIALTDEQEMIRKQILSSFKFTK